MKVCGLAVIPSGNTFYTKDSTAILARYPLPVEEWDSKGMAAALDWFSGWAAERG